MRSFAYPATIDKDESDRFLVTFPDVERCATDAPTLDEALAEAADALDEAIAQRIAAGLDIPAPSRLRRGQRAVPLSAQMAAKAALAVAVRDAGISKSELARRIDVGEAEVRRMLDPRHNTRLSRLEQGLAALGQRLIVHADAA